MPESVRFSFIDSLRGLALLGILAVNAIDIAGVGTTWLEASPGTPLPPDAIREFLGVTTQTRFVPIFNTLFGMSLWFVLGGARARSARPWLVLVRRLVGLVLIGAALALVYPGNILYEYGVVGLVVLPVLLFAPKRAVLVSGLVLTAAAYAVAGGGLAATPGLILLGAALAGAGVPAELERGGRGVAIAFALSTAASIQLVWLQIAQGGGDPRFSTVGGLAGAAMAVAYASGMSLLWRTPARRPLAFFFDPLGRMALSNYVAAAVVVVAAGFVVDFGSLTSVGPVVALCVGLIVVQSLLSRAWLSRFRFGPIEWAWRTATWWRLP